MSIIRFCDILLSLFGLIITLPFNAVIASLIIMDSEGFPLYNQTRLGKNGVPFVLYKWRTMRKNAENGEEILSRDGDDRITSSGRILRNTFLDELPQLYNILKGDMSFVGPRPERPGLSKRFSRIKDWNKRFKVRPGLTGISQLCGVSSNTPEEKARLDRWFVENYSFRLYIKIGLLTCSMVLRKLFGIQCRNYQITTYNSQSKDRFNR